MYCASCGASLQPGSLMCLTCGAAIPERLPRMKTPLPAPAVVPQELAAPPALGPETAMCALHPTVPATLVCSRCGAFACSGCYAAGGGSASLCVRCGTQQLPLASRGSRFAANLIDNAVIAVPAAAGFILSAIFSRGGEDPDLMAVLMIVAGLGGAVVGAVAQIVAQVTWGQSMGKRLLSIKVVRNSGQPIELWRLLLLRNLVVHVIAQACGVVGLVDALLIFGAEQKCLHDYIADSKVVALPPGG